MGLTYRDANDSYLKGYENFYRWSREFMFQWMLPQMELAVAKKEQELLRAWSMVSDDAKERLSIADPIAYNKSATIIRQIESGEFHAAAIRDLANSFLDS